VPLQVAQRGVIGRVKQYGRDKQSEDKLRFQMKTDVHRREGQASPGDGEQHRMRELQRACEPEQQHTAAVSITRMTSKVIMEVPFRRVASARVDEVLSDSCRPWLAKIHELSS
jgi:hypothetical protein